MVELPGTLESSTLGDVLGALHRDRVSGALWLHEISGGREHRHVIVWRDGLIHAVETSRRRSARIASRRVDARWTQDAGDKGELLDRLEALFEIERAKLSFRVMGARRPEAPTPLGPSEFLHGRPRSRDEHAERPPTPRPQPVELDSPRARALRTLGLEGEPPLDDVRAAFRRLARQWHPDRHPGASEPTRAALGKRFAQITGAYEQLIGHGR